MKTEISKVTGREFAKKTIKHLQDNNVGPYLGDFDEFIESVELTDG